MLAEATDVARIWLPKACTSSKRIYKKDIIAQRNEATCHQYSDSKDGLPCNGYCRDFVLLKGSCGQHIIDHSTGQSITYFNLQAEKQPRDQTDGPPVNVQLLSWSNVLSRRRWLQTLGYTSQKINDSMKLSTCAHAQLS